MNQDPYLPSIAEELLKDSTDWKNVEDIVQITLKALTDVVKTQGETITELEH